VVRVITRFEPEFTVAAAAVTMEFAAENAPALTVIPSEVVLKPPPLAVMFFTPEDLSVMAKVPTPLVRVDEAGRVACPSFELMETTPENPVAMFPPESRAVTVKVVEFPALTLAGIEVRASWVAFEALTVMAVEVALRAPSVAVKVLLPAVLKVRLKVPTPFTSVLATGKTAFASVEVKLTVPV